MSITRKNLQAIEQAAAERFKERTAVREKKSEAFSRGDWRAVEDPARVYFRANQLGESEAVLRSQIDPNFNVLERILGGNDLLPASFIFIAAAKLRTVGRISVGGGAGLGTGFLVSPRLVMTNNHVLSNADIAAESYIQFDYLEDSDGQIKQAVAFRFHPQDFFETHEELDFTLVAIESASEQGETAGARGWNPLIPQTGKALYGDRVSIIQHPLGRPLEIALQDNKVVDVFDQFLHYTTDTQPGTSGSGVYNMQWQVAALHRAGVPERDAAGRLIRWKANEGVRISSIMAELESRCAPWSIEKTSLFEGVLSPSPYVYPPSLNATNAPTESSEGFPSTPHSRVQNGVATWTIPVSFSVAVGQTATPPSPATPPASPSSSPTPKSGGSNKLALDEISELRQRARALLESYSNRTYYDAAVDQEAANDYYKGISSRLSRSKAYTTYSQLVQKTHEKEYSYRKAKNQFLYPWVDLHETDQGRELRSIYSGDTFPPEELLARDLEIERELLGRSYLELDEDEIEEALEVRESNRPFNCEHVVCQSWFDKREPMRGDMHHLFACESKCNSFRSNHPYFEFPDEKFREKCGRIDLSEANNRKFEPVAGKGAVARATLYFLLRYPCMVGDRPSEFRRVRLPLILDWHQQNQPNEYERHRNAAIFELQGNRNPLIDRPELAERIDFDRGFGG